MRSTRTAVLSRAESSTSTVETDLSATVARVLIVLTACANCSERTRMRLEFKDDCQRPSPYRPSSVP